MPRYVEVAGASVVAFVLLAVLARTSGVLLLPLLLALLLGLGYVAVQLVRGEPTPYPRVASGVFERHESTAVQLSETTPCESCTDDEGPGERRTTHREVVFLGVPLVRLSTTRTVRCSVCVDPLDSLDDRELDAIDRELDRGR